MDNEGLVGGGLVDNEVLVDGGLVDDGVLVILMEEQEDLLHQ